MMDRRKRRSIVNGNDIEKVVKCPGSLSVPFRIMAEIKTVKN